MRHRKRRSKLSMMTSHRNATMRNMVRSLLKHQRIKTTLARAKEARRLAEDMISLGKADTVAARRRAFAVLSDRDLVGRLFKEIAPLFKTRNSGYTRIIPLGFRRGDGATLALLELTEKKIVEKLPRKKKEKAAKEEAKADVVREGKAGSAEEKAAKEVPHKHEEPKIKAVSKSKPTLEEEKRTEKARSEDKKVADKRGFMKNLRGIFRKRGDR